LTRASNARFFDKHDGFPARAAIAAAAQRSVITRLVLPLIKRRRMRFHLRPDTSKSIGAIAANIQHEVDAALSALIGEEHTTEASTPSHYLAQGGVDMDFNRRFSCHIDKCAGSLAITPNRCKPLATII
jgi:hypothetical protein